MYEKILRRKFNRVETLFGWVITGSIAWEKTSKVTILHRFILIQIQQLVNVTLSFIKTYFLLYVYIK